MKIKQYPSFLFVLFMSLLITSSSFSSKDSEVVEFKIVLENTNNRLKLTGEEGTAFKELSFTLKENVPQGIDQFGMITNESQLNSKDENLANFEFTIEKTTEGFVLVGKKGTAWTKLDFDFSKKNQKATVNQYGVTVD